MPPDGPFSAAMVGVYTSFSTLLFFIVKSYFEGRERKRVQAALLEEKAAALEEIKLRRQWEIEDREAKKQATRSAEEARRAAAAAARIANETRREVVESRGERAAQLDQLKADVKASNQASVEALNAANGHNQKIADMASLAAQTMEHLKTTVTMEPVPEKQVVPKHST